MNILVVSPAPPFPTTAGNRARVLAVCEALREAGHTLSFAWTPEEHEDVTASVAYFEGRFLTLGGNSVPQVRRRNLPNLLRKFGRRLGLERAHVWGLDDWFDPSWIAELRAFQARENFDAVLVNYVFHSAAFLAFDGGVRKVLETHDDFADRHVRLRSMGLEPEWFSTTRAEQARALARAQVVLAIEDSEAERFRSSIAPGTRLATIPPFLDVARRVDLHPGPRAVVVASANEMNREGVEWFLRDVMPLVRRDVPDFELVLAGDICKRIPDGPGIVRLGRVRDVRDAYLQAAMSLNPVRGGTGFCIKSLEAVAYGSPLVATPAGSRGLSAIDARAWIGLPDEVPERVAAAIVALCQDAGAREEMGRLAWEAGRSWTGERKADLRKAFEQPEEVES